MSSSNTGLILRDNKAFRAHLDDLKKGDIIIGLLNIKPTEEVLFLDLSEREITLYPSALSQQLSRSKCLQAMVFKKWMVPNTFVARDRHDMIQQIDNYSKQNIKRVVTKQNRLNCGLGIHIWNSIEDVYNQACFGSLTYPFVVQPFVKTSLDVRVIVLGDYLEAYWRKNPHCFRNNLYFGGQHGQYELTEQQWNICQQVMERGRFPYAHIDLMITEDGDTYLSEINLRGGLKGAQITTSEYQDRIQRLEDEFLASVTSSR